MELSAVASNRYSEMTTQLWSYQQSNDTNRTASQSSSKRDVVEISSEAYELQTETEQMSATSGKDTLEISKGDTDNIFVIHFSNSALLSRMITRGYLTVNGVKIELSEEVKNQLTEIDKQTEKDREEAFYQEILQHNMNVAKQQGEVLKDEAKRMAQALAIAAKMASGAKVSHEDEQFLMKYDPQMYAMAKSAAIMAERQEKQEEKKQCEQISKEDDAQKSGVDNTSTTENSEWKTFETTMTVSLGETPKVQDISENEICIK